MSNETPMSNENPMPESKLQNFWLTDSVDDLITRHASTVASVEPVLSKFLELGLPILKKLKSIFVAEMGDIQTFLLVHSDSATLKIELCMLDDNGSPTPRISEVGDTAQLILKSYVACYPQAVFTTQQRKPMCLFVSKNGDNSATKSDDKKSLGQLVGPMNFETFKHHFSRESTSLTVAVP